MYDVKICWHFYSSALNDRRDLGNEEQMSALACRTKELDISTMLRPVFPPLLVSAGLAFCLRLIGWSLPFSLTVWTLTCQKRKKNNFDNVLSLFYSPHRSLLGCGKVWLNLLSGGVGERDRAKRREEGGKGDTTATICSMWPSLFSIRAAIHGMVLLITAHNTFSGMEHNLPVARWTSRVASRRARPYICGWEFVLFK